MHTYKKRRILLRPRASESDGSERHSVIILSGYMAQMGKARVKERRRELGAWESVYGVIIIASAHLHGALSYTHVLKYICYAR